MSFHPTERPGRTALGVDYRISVCARNRARRLQAEGLRLPERSTELCGLPALLARRAYIRSAPADELAMLDIESAVFALTGELARESSDEVRWLPVAREYLRAHFASKLSLAEIAAVAGIHPVHLSRAFPRRFGMTVGDYVRALRLDYAARELMTTRRPIVDIALDAGFASQAHLTRHFSARMGVAPAAFRASC